MGEKKILNINANPELHGYSFLLNPLAILTSSDFVSDYLARFTLCDYEQFIFQSQKIKEKHDDECLSLYADIYDTDLQCKYYKRYEQNCYFKGAVLYHQYTDSWATFGVFICDELSISFKDISEIEGYYLGFTHGWGFIEVENHNINKLDIPYSSKPFHYKIVQDDGKIIISFYSDDELVVVREKKVSDYNIKYFGIYFNFFENRFYNWYYMNYIQIHYHEEMKEIAGCPVELLALPTKKYYYYLLHPLLDYCCISYDLFEALDTDIVEYAKQNINKYNYIVLTLNEYYVPMREAYKKNPYYVHDNMIYGYDDGEQCVYVLGFNHGMPTTSTVGYLDLKKAFILKDETNIVSIKYSPDYYCVKFNIKVVYSELCSYLYSQDSTNKYEMFMVEKPRLYGMSIYDRILEPIYFRMFLEDLRIAYTLYEHNKHILSIVRFIYVRGFLTDEQHRSISKQFEEIVRECNILISLVLKYQFKKTSEITQNIRQKLCIVKDKEMISYHELIKILEVN